MSVTPHAHCACGTTSQLVKTSTDMVARAAPFLALPPVRAALVPVGRSLDAFLEGTS